MKTLLMLLLMSSVNSFASEEVFSQLPSSYPMNVGNCEITDDTTNTVTDHPIVTVQLAVANCRQDSFMFVPYGDKYLHIDDVETFSVEAVKAVFQAIDQKDAQIARVSALTKCQAKKRMILTQIATMQSTFRNLREPFSCR